MSSAAHMTVCIMCNVCGCRYLLKVCVKQCMMDGRNAGVQVFLTSISMMWQVGSCVDPGKSIDYAESRFLDVSTQCY